MAAATETTEAAEAPAEVAPAAGPGAKTQSLLPPLAHRRAAGGRRRRRGVRVALLAGAAFLVGLAAANGPALGDRAARLLALMGQPRLDAMQALEEPVVGADGVARSDWLVFFERETPEPERERLLARHEPVRFVERTIFPNGVVVSVPEPSGPVIEALRASPAVWLVLKDRPFLLCH